MKRVRREPRIAEEPTPPIHVPSFEQQQSMLHNPMLPGETHAQAIDRYSTLAREALRTAAIDHWLGVGLGFNEDKYLEHLRNHEKAASDFHTTRGLLRNVTRDIIQRRMDAPHIAERVNEYLGVTGPRRGNLWNDTEHTYNAVRYVPGDNQEGADPDVTDDEIPYVVKGRKQRARESAEEEHLGHHVGHGHRTVDAEEGIALSDADIRALLPGCRITLYTELARLPSIHSIFDSNGRAVVLYLTESKTSGHWVGLLKRPYGIEYFDAYGLKPGSPLHWNPVVTARLKESPCHITRLLESSGLPVTYNTHCFQKHSNRVATCGRHVVVRHWNRSKTLNDYARMIHASGMDPDEFVTVQTDHGRSGVHGGARPKKLALPDPLGNDADLEGTLDPTIQYFLGRIEEKRRMVRDYPTATHLQAELNNLRRRMWHYVRTHGMESL